MAALYSTLLLSKQWSLTPFLPIKFIGCVIYANTWPSSRRYKFFTRQSSRQVQLFGVQPIMDHSPTRRILSLGILTTLLLPVGCTEVCYARIRIASKNKETLFQIENTFTRLGWREQEKITSGRRFRKEDPPLNGMAIYLEIANDATHKILFSIAGTSQFDADAMSNYKDLIALLEKNLNFAIDYDKKSNKGQTLIE